ncbi:hypothetical protein [Chitinophaga deserti]|uniref:hypothetical protein n=1 Tax=Chitinophaga deserti TaxID=2164099 RepID=UPI000D6CD7CC|nr:hypothetical protein [Chitinophaga deserti]
MKVFYSLSFLTFLVLTAFTSCRKSNPILSATVEGILREAETKEPLGNVKIRLQQCPRKGAQDCKVIQETLTRPDGTFSFTYKGRKKTDYYLTIAQSDSLKSDTYKAATHPDWEKYQVQMTAFKLAKTNLHLIIRKNAFKGPVWVSPYQLRAGIHDTTFTFFGHPDYSRVITVAVMDSVAGYVRGQKVTLTFSRDQTNSVTHEIADMLLLPKL